MAFVDDLFSDWGRHGGFGGGGGGGYNPFSSFYEPRYPSKSKQQYQTPGDDPRYEARYETSRKSAPRDQGSHRRSSPPTPAPKEIEREIEIMGDPEPIRSPPKRAAAPPSSPPKPKKVYQFRSKSEAVKKIQAVFRGFQVRRGKPIKQLRAVKVVAEKFAAIVQSVADPAAMAKIVASKRERYILNERVTLLLLSLDEISTVVPFVKEVRKALIVKLQEFTKPLDEKDREEAAAAATAAEEAAEKEAAEVEDNHDDGFLIVNHGDVPASIEIKAPASIEVEVEAPSIEVEVPVSIDNEAPTKVAAEDQAAPPKVAEGWRDEAIKQLMQDNTELKSMVSKCLQEIQKQNSTISKLKTRVRVLERTKNRKNPKPAVTVV